MDDVFGLLVCCGGVLVSLACYAMRAVNPRGFAHVLITRGLLCLFIFI